MHMAFSMKVTPEIEELTNICLDNSKMDVSLYGQYDVKRGLRDNQRRWRPCGTDTDFKRCVFGYH